MPLFTVNPANYRLRIIADITRSILIPTFSLQWFIHRTDCIHLPLFPLILLHIITLTLYTSLRLAYHDFRHARIASRLGAQQIPRVRGRWPGNIDVLLRMMKDFKTSYPGDVYLRLFEELGSTTINLRLLWRDTILTKDAKHSKYVLTTGFQHFWRGRYQKERMENTFGTGIFNRDDEAWRAHRATARPFFANDRIRDLELFSSHTSHALSLINPTTCSNSQGTPTPIDAQDLYARFTLDTASSLLFGKDLNTLSLPLPIPGKTAVGAKGSASEGSWGAFVDAFESCQQVITDRARMGPSVWPLVEAFGDRTQRHVEVIREWLTPIVEEAIEESKRAKAKSGCERTIAETTFLQHLADSTSDPVVIRDELLSMLLASRDTTASVLSYATYLFALHPTIVQKLRAEVIQHCGLTDVESFDQLRDLKYMRAVLNEVLRLFPPIPVNTRETRSEPVVLPPSDSTYQPLDQRPYYMPAETVIQYIPLLIQRSPALWGEDAHDFDPDRWTDPERVKRYVQNPAIYAPFSAGARICIGQNFAYNEMTYFLVRLLQRFDRFTLAKDVQPAGSLPPPAWQDGTDTRRNVEEIWPGAAMTMYIKGGLWVNFHPASNVD